MIRILLAEDHQLVREGIKLLVANQADMEVVAEAGDGREAIRLAEQLRPDVILMDISMPGMNGLEATSSITSAWPEARVLALTRHSDEGFLQRLLSAGAAGYVLKQSAPSELLSAVRAVASGRNYLDPAIAGKVMEGYTHLRGRSGEPRAEPTEREAEVLRLTARGYTNKEIASQLDISVKTVETHKANVMRKLDMHGRTDIVRYALLRGWLRD